MREGWRGRGSGVRGARARSFGPVAVIFIFVGVRASHGVGEGVGGERGETTAGIVVVLVEMVVRP